LPPGVWILGGISLLTDTATEAIYPLLPLFLTGVLGARVAAIGVVEGAAEAVASVLKVVSGRLADRLGRRRVFVVAGYSLSSLARPMIGLAGTWGHVFALRLTDRVGKGLRSAPRDAILASLATPDTRGRVFGFHRAMDHAGAVVGPLLAAVFLWFAPGHYRALFLLTIIPGLAVVALVTKTPRDDGKADAGSTTSAGASGGSWRHLPRGLRRLLLVLLLFALGNSTDAYLLLRLSDLGVATALIPLLWSGLHVVKASTSVVGGELADRIGRRPLIVAGWCLYAAIYAGFARVTGTAAAVVLFLLYGAYFGMTEGAEKALVADLSPASLRGTAFGWYNAVTGFGALGASVLFGLVWEWRGPDAAFGLGAALALAAAGSLAVSRNREPQGHLES
jgi:MFS family permease